ncbi:MAG: TonB family protein [Bacteroidia bacterium]|nr:TonB family protein [Bacteroidia bacterium]
MLYNFWNNANAQEDAFDKQLNAEILKVDSIGLSQLKSNQFYIESPFAKGFIKSNPTLDTVINQVIYRIDLVYTTYKLSPAFNQKELNRERLQALQKYAPHLFKDNLITWGQIAITGAQNVAQGQQMFHGFIFTYRVADTKTTRSEELLYIKKIMGDTVISDKKGKDVRRKIKIPVYKKRYYDKVTMPQYSGGTEALNTFLKEQAKYPPDSYRNKKQGTVVLSFNVNTQGQINTIKIINGIDVACNSQAITVMEQMPKWLPAKKNGRATNMQMQLPIIFDYNSKIIFVDSVKGDSLIKNYNPKGKFEETYIDSVEATDEYFKMLSEQDSSVLKVLIRNAWQPLVFVCDVTGSMAPYTSQMLLWFKQPAMRKRVAYFYFFNDGNNIADSKKRIGLTGGVYPVSNVDFSQVTQTIYEAMTNGDGGDIPENNIEAVLTACQKFSDSEIVMIADNFATPRDIELTNKLCRPIHIVLCGTYGGINTNYMDIARSNKGTLHTIDSDIINLSQITEGQELIIDGHIYQLKNNKFEMIK